MRVQLLHICEETFRQTWLIDVLSVHSEQAAFCNVCNYVQKKPLSVCKAQNTHCLRRPAQSVYLSDGVPLSFAWFVPLCSPLPPWLHPILSPRFASFSPLLPPTRHILLPPFSPAEEFPRGLSNSRQLYPLFAAPEGRGGGTQPEEREGGGG